MEVFFGFLTSLSRIAGEELLSPYHNLQIPENGVQEKKPSDSAQLISSNENNKIEKTCVSNSGTEDVRSIRSQLRLFRKKPVILCTEKSDKDYAEGGQFQQKNISNSQQIFGREMVNNEESVENDIQIIYPQISEKVAREWECCGKVFFAPSHFKKHLLSLRHQNRSKCHLCGETFSSKSDLGNHEQSAHSKFGSKFICEICKAVLSSRNKLTQHIACLHVGDRQFKCTVCNYAAKSKYLRDRHFNRRHADLQEVFKCEFCGLILKGKGYLAAHIKAVHGNNRVQCSVCYRTFSEKRELELHMRYHLPGRNYFCQVCGKAFKTLSHRERHVVIHTKHFGKKNKFLSGKWNYKEKEKNGKSRKRTSSQNNNKTPNKQKSSVYNRKSFKGNTSTKPSCNTLINPDKRMDIQEVDEFIYVDVEGINDDSTNLDETPHFAPHTSRRVENPSFVTLESDDSSCDLSNCSGCSSSSSSLGDSRCSSKPANKKAKDLLGSTRKTMAIVCSNMESQIRSTPHEDSQRNEPTPSQHSVLSSDNSCFGKPKKKNVQSGYKKENDSKPAKTNNKGKQNGATKCIKKRSPSSSKISLNNSNFQSLLTRKEQNKSKTNRPSKLREITMREINLQSTFKACPRLSAEPMPQLETNFARELENSKESSNHRVCASVPDLVELDNSPLLCAAPRKPRKAVTQRKKPQNRSNKKTRDSGPEPRVFVTNIISGDSDAFLLPEFYTEEDTENCVPLCFQENSANLSSLLEELP